MSSAGASIRHWSLLGHDEVASLTSEISSHLPALEQRVRRRELLAVVREAVAQGDPTPGGFLQLANAYTAQTGARRAALEELRAAYAAVTTPQQRCEVIMRALRSQDAPPRAYVAAQRGWLDLEAMAERSDLAVHELCVRHSLAVRAAAALASGATVEPVIQCLLEYLVSSLPPMCLVAAAEALCELLAHARHAMPERHGQIPGELWQQIGARLSDTAAPRRVQAALLRLCLHAVPSIAYGHLEARLLHAVPGDDFLIRQHIVVLLGQRGRDGRAFALLNKKAQAGDPSEHVRLALPAALRATGGAEAVAALQALAGRLVDGVAGDASPRVRAAAAIALAELLYSREADTVAALQALLADPDSLVYQTVAEEIESLASHNRVTEAEAATLSVAVAAIAARAATTQLAEPALRAREALAAVTQAPLAMARSLLAPQLAALPPGATISLRTPVEPLTLGRLLAQLSHTGFGYYAQPIAGGYRIERGARFVQRAWRLVHELRWRTPYKRQDAQHGVGREFPGTLRAHSALLAEATPTAVPGEPLASPSDGTWGPHLPTVDDLLSTALLRPTPVFLFSSRGLTRIVPPSSLLGRLRARFHLNARYSQLADRRLRALDPADPSELTGYLEAIEALGFRMTMEPYPSADRGVAPLVPTVAAPFARRAGTAAAGACALALLGSPDGVSDLVHYFLSPAENTLQQLGIAALVACVVMLIANLVRRQQVRHDRAAIPLVIGGWGTRGKSGTERLKAGLLHALDLDVLVKTTGCEAMFIHGVPGHKPTEIFIHRSYDKATIWEQRDLLTLAARMRSHVFLWECMALSGPLVRILSEEWMADDLQTLTNAYPDHEDIQGPAGHDVASSIAGFMRSGGTAITTEEQMLPLLEDAARRKHARLIAVPPRAHLLLADDLLARFPYREHPRNIALVRRMAVYLGLDADLATADMADHVVPDLGVLKAYPAMHHRGRALTFVNGMSANERTGFLSNWQRTGCERQVDEPGRWVVTVVNNRFDRVSRSKVFAEVLVRDASAERHVLIGTNLSGLRVYIEQSLDHFLPELRLFRPAQDERDGEGGAQLEKTLQARSQRLRHRLRIGLAEPAVVLTELSAWLGGADVSRLAGGVQAALAAAAGWADAESPLGAIQSKLRELPFARELSALVPAPATGPQAELMPPADAEEVVAHACRSIARRALLASLLRAARRALSEYAERAAVIARQDRLYRELFMDLVVVVEDPGASGDQVIDSIAHACPPGIDATVMGIQNIKGTGLDFVYRFIRYDEVNTLVERLAQASGEQARSIAADLINRTDFGMLDSALAARAVEEAAARCTASAGSDAALGSYLRDVAAQLTEIARRCQTALQAGQKQHRNRAVRIIEKLLDTMDAVRRRYRSEKILDALVHREISHERAAFEARRLVDREKKGWLRG